MSWLTKEKLLFLFLSGVSLIFLVSSYKTGLYSENGVGPGFTPFLASIVAFLLSIYHLKSSLKFKSPEWKIIGKIFLILFCMWMSLYFSVYLIVAISFFFSYIFATKKSLKNSFYISIFVLILIFLFGLMGVEID